MTSQKAFGFGMGLTNVYLVIRTGTITNRTPVTVKKRKTACALWVKKTGNGRTAVADWKCTLFAKNRKDLYYLRPWCTAPMLY